jgi:predicted Na+-dependent transporter
MAEIFRSLVRLASSQLVTLLALEVGLGLGTGEVRRQIRNPVLGRTLLVALLGVPMLAILVAVTLPVGPVVRGVIVLMAVSPGAPMLMNRSQASGNVALAAALVVALTIAAVVFLPVELFVLNRVFPWRLHASTPALLENVGPKLVLPLVFGAMLHRLWPKAADRFARVVQALFYAALLVTVVGALAVSWREIVNMGPWAWLAMLIVTTGAVLMGDAFGGRDPRDRATAAYAVVLGNPAVAISVVAVSYPSLHAVPIIIAYAVLRAVFVLPYAVLAHRRLASGRT